MNAALATSSSTSSSPQPSSIEDPQWQHDIIANLVTYDHPTAGLFTSQFLVSVQLRRQLEQVTGSGCPSNQLFISREPQIFDLPEVLTNQKEQGERFKEARRKMHSTI